MARFAVEGSTLVLRLSGLERLGAFILRDPSAPLSAIRSVRVSENPWSELRGLRVPGTGLPGVIMLGTLRGHAGRDFAAVYRHRRAVVVDIEGGLYGRLIASVDDPERVAAAIREAAGL